MHELRERRAWAYENPRPEVQELVPRDARRILDLGCSSGGLGAALKQRQRAEVIGVELDERYAGDAAARLDRVIVADIEQLALDTSELGVFDCVIAADVLEHLRDPWSVLGAFAGTLREGGTAVVSVPNVRYWETFWVLARWGVWPVRDEGIFDRDHLRWFTVHDARNMMEQVGLTVTAVSPSYRIRPASPDSGRLAQLLYRTKLRHFLAFQYVLAGVKTGA